MSVTLSIIIPAYNAERYLADCLNSVLASTYRDFEILLVDDGSTDTTGEICDRFQQDHPQIKVFHTENRGPSMARNLGLDHATGKYVGFVDTDDMVHPAMYEKLVDAIENTATQLACCRYVKCQRSEIPEDDQCSGKRTEEDRKGIANRFLSTAYNVMVWNKLFCRDVLVANNVKFHKECLLAEDLIFVTDYLQHIQRGVFIDHKLYYYIETKDSITDNWTHKKLGAKYMFEPRSWRRVAVVLETISPQCADTARFRAAVNYQRILKRLSDPEEDFIREAQAYSRKYKKLLWQLPETRKLYFSAILLSFSYPLWAKLFRRGI